MYPKRDSCKFGHPFNDENTYLNTRKNGVVVRYCKRCKRDRFEKSGGNDRTAYYHERRNAALAILGASCVRCGLDDRRVLQIDHIVACGRRAREKWPKIFSSIINGHSNNYQVLCANCHMIKTLYPDEF